MNSHPVEQPYYDVLRFLYRMTQDQALAERLTLEIARRVRVRTAPGKGLATELYRIAYEASREAACTVNGDPLRRTVAALDARHRAALLLHKFHGLGCREIAGIIGCPAEAVAQHLLRAYQCVSAVPAA